MKLIDLYEQYRTKNRKLRAASTDLVYRIAIRQLGRALGHEPTIADLTDDNLVLLENHLASRAPATINERTGRIKALWRWYAKQGGIPTWPTIDRLPVPEPYRRAWTVEQVETLLRATASRKGSYGGVSAAQWWRAYLLVLWDTGERSGAARALRFDWLTKDGILVPAEVRKGHKSAFYRLSRETRRSIDEIAQPPRQQIFPWSLSDSSFYLHYGKLLVAAGLPCDRKSKSQRMRRTHLTFWSIGGGDPTARAKHTSRAVTETYYLDESMLPQPDPEQVLPHLTETATATEVTEAALLR